MFCIKGNDQLQFKPMNLSKKMKTFLIIYTLRIMITKIWNRRGVNVKELKPLLIKFKEFYFGYLKKGCIFEPTF